MHVKITFMHCIEEINQTVEYLWVQATERRFSINAHEYAMYVTDTVKQAHCKKKKAVLTIITIMMNNYCHINMIKKKKCIIA
jgi:hypothetical protein